MGCYLKVPIENMQKVLPCLFGMSSSFMYQYSIHLNGAVMSVPIIRCAVFTHANSNFDFDRMGNTNAKGNMLDN